MLGKPKYKYGDKVKFSIDIAGDMCEFVGEIKQIDKYGTFFEPDDVSYDILVSDETYKSDKNPEGKCLFKHITEKLVTKI